MYYRGEKIKEIIKNDYGVECKDIVETYKNLYTDKELVELRKKLEELKNKIAEIEYERYRKKEIELTEKYWKTILNRVFKKYPELLKNVEYIDLDDYLLEVFFDCPKETKFSVMMHYVSENKPYISVFIRNLAKRPLGKEIMEKLPVEATVDEIVNIIGKYKDYLTCDKYALEP